MNYKKISTSRLLKLFQNLRNSLYARVYYDYEDEYDDTNRMYEDLDEMKKELDTREHVPRKHEIKRKEKKHLPYSRK